MDKCPACGSDLYSQAAYVEYECGSRQYAFDGFVQSDRCLIAVLKAENAALREELTAEKVEVLRLRKVVADFIAQERKASRE